MEQVLENMKQWMAQYIKGFYTKDEDIQENILLKELHTQYVVRHCRELAVNLGLTKREILLAEMVGLFHDVGRFRQYTVYRTFNDRVSLNHAVLGLKILNDMPLLRQLSAADRQTFTFAISQHNALHIELPASDRDLLFAKLIRDADKLDIYRVLQPMLAPSDGSGYSEICKRCFLEGRQCDFAAVKTTDDRKAVRLLWLYDIHFGYTMRRILELGYAEEIIRHLPENETTVQGSKRLLAYMNKKAKEELGQENSKV